MFKKQFTQKSSSLLKKVDRKGLQERIKSNFFLEEDTAEKILPRKQDITITRIVTNQAEDVTVYSVEKRAMLFEYYQRGIEGKRLIPTVYLLWQYPELVYAFTVHEGVLGYILSGAHLMMPGVVKSSPRGPITYFLDNQVAAISTVNNKAAVAVGLTDMSGNSSMGGQQGKVLTVLHYYTDFLCSLHDMPLLKRPQRRSIEEEAREAMQHVFQDLGWPTLGESEAAAEAFPLESDNVVTEVTAAIRALTLEEPGNSTDNLTIVPAFIAVDAALKRCFMIAAKYSPTLLLPQLTSSFYKKEMGQMMAADQQVDIKSSSYKKVSEFLKAMERDGLCKLGQKQKGVDIIEEIHYTHKEFTEFYLPVESRPQIVEEACENPTDAYIVVPEVVDIFLPKYRVGAAVTLSITKKAIIDYIKKNGLQDIEKEYSLARTPVLQRLSPPGSTRVPNEDLLNAVVAAMEDGSFKPTSLHSASTSATTQARLSRPVRMQIQTHSGKTVTIVSNLQDYSNVHLATFAKEIQVIAAASAKIIKETRHVQVQGNQIDIIATLLNKKYGISKSKIMGLELAPKLKKCKH